MRLTKQGARMSNRIEIELDDQGRLVLPGLLAHQLGLVQGTTLIVDQDNADVTYLRVQKPVSSSPLVDKGGILVIRTTTIYPEDNLLHEERERRLDALWNRDYTDLI